MSNKTSNLSVRDVLNRVINDDEDAMKLDLVVNNV